MSQPMRSKLPQPTKRWKTSRKHPPSSQWSRLHLPLSPSTTKTLNATLLVTMTLMPCSIQRLTTPLLVLSRVDLEHVLKSLQISRLRSIWTTIPIFKDNLVTEELLPLNRLKSTGSKLATKTLLWLPLSRKVTSHTNVLEMMVKPAAIVQVLFTLVQKFGQTANNRLQPSMR